MPTRYDAATLGQAKRTPQGFLRAPARLTRTGVLTYRRGDGTTQRELRRPEQVFSPASLATLGDAPLTDLHPKVMVGPHNARELSLGHVSQATVRRDGRFVAGEVVVTDGALIKAIEDRKRGEVSLGYNCKIIAGGGSYEGERYDCEQVDIVYNHAALGPSNWGRAGSEVALRLDGAEEALELGAEDAWRSDHDDPPPPGKDTDTMDLVTVRIDSIDTQVPPAAQQLITRALEQRDAKVLAAEQAASDAKKRCDALQGELDGTTKKLEAATDPKRFDAAVKARMVLLDKATKVLGAEAKLDGLTDREIKERVVKHVDKDAEFTGKSDEYVQGRFDACEAPAAGGGDDPLDRARKAAISGGGGGAPRKDAGDPPKFEPPAWKKPFASTRPQ